MPISTRLLAQQQPDSSYIGYLYSLTRDIQGMKQVEDAYTVLAGRGVLPGSPAVAAVSGATVKLPAGFALFSDGVVYTVPADTNFTPARLSATVWMWGRIAVTRPTVTPAAPAYSTQDSYSLTLLETVGAVPLPPDGFTTVTTGAASATQLVGTTAAMSPGDMLWFAGAGAARVVASVTDATHVVLTATVTTTTAEAVLEVGASPWMLLATWATDGSGNVSGAVSSQPNPGPAVTGKWLHTGNQFGFRVIPVGGTGSYTLSPFEARDTFLRLTGVLTGARNLIVPTEAGRAYCIENATTGAFALTVKTAAGAGIAITAAAAAAWVYCDGTDIKATA